MWKTLKNVENFDEKNFLHYFETTIRNQKHQTAHYKPIAGIFVCRVLGIFYSL